MSENRDFRSAELLQKQADAVLERLQLPTLVEEVGTLYFTGSYALQLMAWNDIDLQIALKAGLTPSAALMQLLDAVVHLPHFLRGKVIHFSGDYKPHWPRGYCLNLTLDFPDLGGIWKFDIWVLEQHALEQNQALVQQLRDALTQETRLLILQMKRMLIERLGRMPKMGSHWLYQAIVFEGLREQEAILSFLRTHGVSMGG